MKKVQRYGLKKFLSAFLTAALLAGTAGYAPVEATGMVQEMANTVSGNDAGIATASVSGNEGESASHSTTAVYETENVTITLTADSVWEGAWNAKAVIENKGAELIDDWHVRLFLNQKITNIWNADILQDETKGCDGYLIQNAGWNQDIPAGGSVTFGFTVSGSFAGLPEVCELQSANVVVAETDYEAIYEITNDWRSGFTANIILTNTSQEVITDWQLSFTQDNDITSLWNGEILSHEGNRYVVKNPSYCQNLMPGESITIGFVVSNGTAVNKVSDMVLEQKNPLLSQREEVVEEPVELTVDTSGFTMHPNMDIYVITEKVMEIKGSLTNADTVGSLRYVVEDIRGVVVDSGSLEVHENWCIKEPGLVVGTNRLTVTAVTLSGTEYICEAAFLNYNRENMEASDVDLSDSDGDGLHNYLEELLGTDKDGTDTDGDGISDSDEMLKVGTDPLLPDTDANGVWDGKEDYDEDGLESLLEITAGTNPLRVDTDDDGLLDGEELQYGTDPLQPDTDGDTLTDGQETELGTDPGKPDSDGDAITDEKEIYYQTHTKELEQTYRSEIKEVSVTMDCAGHIDNAVYVLDTYNIDMRSTELVGLVGVPVDISCYQEFDDATITFSYDETALSETEEENLGILWYDEENDNYVLVEDAVVDTQNNTVSCTTDHFSTWLLVDRKQWTNLWKNKVFAYKEGHEEVIPSLTLQMEDGVHRYQLFENDGSFQEAEEICEAAGGYLATIQSYLENAAVYEYILEQDCVSAYIGLSDEGHEGQWQWSNGEDVDFTYWHRGEPNGGTLENYAMYYYKYKDGSWNDGSFNSGFTVQDVSIFVCEWENLDLETDTDGDGLPDYYETIGFRMSNGTLVFTDPLKVDTDGDGISDYDEVGGLPEWEEYVIGGKVYRVLVNHPSTYGKLSGEFLYVDGRMNSSGVVNNDRMDYVPYSNELRNMWYVTADDIKLFGENRDFNGASNIHGLFADKLDEIGFAQKLGYGIWNMLVTDTLYALQWDISMECFLDYATGIGGFEPGIDHIVNRKYIKADNFVDMGIQNSANVCFEQNMLRAIRAAEGVLDENNREIYITMSPEVSWDGSFYNDTTGLFNEYTIGTICNALAFSIFNKSKAGVTLHCTYDPETQTYEMEYLYYLMDLYDFSFLAIMEEQDALGIAKNYELYGVSEGHATWQKGDDLMLLYPHTIMERTDF